MKKRAAVTGLAAIGLYALGIGALTGWEKTYPVAEYLSVPPSSTLRSFGAGYDNMIADGLYLQFVNYFGKHLSRDRAYHNVMPVLDAVTDLDPSFRGSYFLGALALGDSGRLDELETLMGKSVKAFPNDWQVAFDAGMAVFVFADKPERYLKAGRFFKLAASHPDAKPDARYMEARCYDVAGRRQMTIQIWADMYRNAPSPEARTVAERALQRLGALKPGKRASE